MKKDRLKLYANSVIGKNIDVDKAFNSQCIDLVKHYSKEVLKYTLGTFWWSAKNGWLNTSNTFPPTDFIPVDPKELQKWDIVFWYGGRYSKYGHVWIVLENRWKTILCLDQNNWTWTGIWKENAVREYEYTFENIVWWYRHKKTIFEYKWIPVFQEEQPKDKPNLNWAYVPKIEKGGYITIYPNAFIKYKDNITSLLQHEYAHYVWFEKLTEKQRQAFSEISTYSDFVRNDPRNAVIPYKENAFINKRSEQFVTEDFAYIWQEYFDNHNKVYNTYLDYKK